MNKGSQLMEFLFADSYVHGHSSRKAVLQVVGMSLYPDFEYFAKIG